MSTGESPRLPGLRQELQLLEGADTVLGHRTWLVFDPVMHRYFQLDLASFRLLGLWGECRTRDELLVKARDLDGVLDADAKLAELLEFIEHNNLVEEAGNGWRRHAGNADRQRKSWMDWLLHSYLFIRIPLFRPDRFLRASQFPSHSPGYP